MDIEREMGAIKREIALQDLLEHPAATAPDRLQSRPEKPVMDDEKIHVGLDSACNRPGRSVYGRADFRDRAGVLDLKPIEGIGPIIDFAHAQVLVGVGYELRLGRDARHCAEGG